MIGAVNANNIRLASGFAVLIARFADLLTKLSPMPGRRWALCPRRPRHLVPPLPGERSPAEEMPSGHVHDQRAWSLTG